MTEGRQRRSGRMTDTTSYSDHMRPKQLDAQKWGTRCKSEPEDLESHIKATEGYWSSMGGRQGGRQTKEQDAKR